MGERYSLRIDQPLVGRCCPGIRGLKAVMPARAFLSREEVHKGVGFGGGQDLVRVALAALVLRGTSRRLDLV